MDKTSPRPWTIIDKKDGKIGFDIASPIIHHQFGRERVGRINTFADAELICRAVNRDALYDELLDTLEGISEDIECDWCLSEENDDGIFIHEKDCKLMELIHRARAQSSGKETKGKKNDYTRTDSGNYQRFITINKTECG